MRKVDAICGKSIWQKRTKQWTRCRENSVCPLYYIDSSLPSFQSCWHLFASGVGCNRRNSHRRSTRRQKHVFIIILYDHMYAYCIQYPTQRTHMNGQQNSIIYYKIPHNVADCIVDDWNGRCEAHATYKLNSCTSNEKNIKPKSHEIANDIGFCHSNEQKQEKNGVKIFSYCLFRIYLSCFWCWTLSLTSE